MSNPTDAQSVQALYDAIFSAIGRMTMPPLKAILKDISDSRTIKHVVPLSGRKRDLLDRIRLIFDDLRQPANLAQFYEARDIVQKQYGSAIVAAAANRSYASPQIVGPQSHTAAAAQRPAPGMTAAAYQGYGAGRPPSYQANGYHYNPGGQATSSNGSYAAQNQIRMGTFKPSPFYRIVSWITSPVVCPPLHYGKAPPAKINFRISAPTVADLQDTTSSKQLRIFSTTLAANQASYDGRHPAPVEFPLICEVRVNKLPLTVNLKAKKTAAKVLPPNINKDNRVNMYANAFNEVDLIYADTQIPYIIALALCEMKSVKTLASEVAKEHIKSREDVLKEMKRAADDDDIEVGEVTINLKCPLGYTRLVNPCRSSVCTHIQCFDALSFFSVNEVKPTWLCPICNLQVDPTTLFLDGYVKDILDRVPESEEVVNIDAEGRWRTPNNRYRSEEVASTFPNDSNNSDVSGAATPHKSRGTGDTSDQQRVKGEIEPTNRLSNLPTPPLAATPSGPRQREVEVFDLDDSPSPPPPTGTLATSSSVTAGDSSPSLRAEQPSALPLAQSTPSNGVPSSSHDAASSVHPVPAVSSTVSDGSSVMMQSTGSSYGARGQAFVANGNSTSNAIDLTLSDSDDDDDAFVPRRALPSTSMLATTDGPAITSRALPSTSMLSTDIRPVAMRPLPSPSDGLPPSHRLSGAHLRAPNGAASGPLDRFFPPLARAASTNASTNTPSNSKSVSSDAMNGFHRLFHKQAFQRDGSESSNVLPARSGSLTDVSRPPANGRDVSVSGGSQPSPGTSLPARPHDRDRASVPLLLSQADANLQGTVPQSSVAPINGRASSTNDAASSNLPNSSSAGERSSVRRSAPDEGDEERGTNGRPQKRSRNDRPTYEGDAMDELDQGPRDELDEFADLEFPDDQYFLHPESGLDGLAGSSDAPSATTADTSRLGPPSLHRSATGTPTPSAAKDGGADLRRSSDPSSNTSEETLYQDERAGLGTGRT